MKNINRMALGTLSSLLLTAGLARAAQKFDPLTMSLGKQKYGAGLNEGPSSPCGVPCAVQID
jgi:hypothetical protein